MQLTKQVSDDCWKKAIEMEYIFRAEVSAMLYKWVQAKGWNYGVVFCALVRGMAVNFASCSERGGIIESPIPDLYNELIAKRNKNLGSVLQRSLEALAKDF